MNSPLIEELLRLVEEKYEKSLHTSTDFAEFSLFLDKRGYGTVSPSTLKRLWGYVNDYRTPRIATLNILASFLGYPTFNHFTAYLKQSPVYNSSYFFAEHLSSSQVPLLAEVYIGWAPNRILRLRHLGDSKYVILSSENSKLQPGDIFTCGCFIKNQPLCLPYIERDGIRLAAFIAGRNGGLTYLHLCRENESATDNNTPTRQ